MYTTYFNLSGRPFKLSPDHRFYFDGQPHRRAIAYLTYGLSQGDGFVVVTGEVGAGKTTLIDHLLSRLQGNNVITAKLGIHFALVISICWDGEPGIPSRRRGRLPAHPD